MPHNQDATLRRLIDITQSLSSEQDKWRLLERILAESLALTHADGGTLYLLQNDSEGQWLEYGILHNRSLGLVQINRSGGDSALMPIPVYDLHTGAANHQNIATHCALTHRTINISDAYEASQFDISGIRAFDELFDYRTRSMLTLPLQNHAGQVIGVMQLVNAMAPDTTGVVPFTDPALSIVQALASLASIILENSLMLEFQRDLLIRLSSARDTSELFERILDEALAITRAEGGSLYLVRDGKAPRLEFVLLKNQALKLNLGGRHGQPVDMAPLQLEKNGEANLGNIATYTALSQETVNIQNAYHDIRFDFSGMKAFDTDHRYRSRSFLSVPLINHAGTVLGVLQLVNARDPDGQITAFDERQEPIVQALASYAAIALENQQLREDHARLLAEANRSDHAHKGD